MTVIAMSRTEIDRMHVLRDLAAGRITVTEAAQLTRLTRRHVFRLAKAYRERGPSALVSTRRGQPSNHRYPAALRTKTLGLITANYADFGPTLACEKLAERHGLHLGVETVRQGMLADGLWRDRRQRLKPVHQPRYRRDCVGELVQIDGSEHGWFEARGPPCTLLVFVDDATSLLIPSRSLADSWGGFPGGHRYDSRRRSPVWRSPWLLPSRSALTLMPPDSALWRSARGIPIRPAAFWLWRRSMMGPPGPRRLRSAA